MNIRKYIGDEYFYKKVIRIAFPCALSQLLLSGRNIIVSIMVSSIGMVTAVGNAHNILNLHNYIMYGIQAGAALFGAQFFGARQYRNMARTQGAFLILAFINVVIWNVVVFGFGREFLLFYLNDPSLVEYSLSYLKLVMPSLFLLVITMSFKTMYQCMHKTRLTFAESSLYVLLNLINNYLFIFVFRLGIKGAGYASLLTEILCCLAMVTYTLKDRPAFYLGIKAMLDFDANFVEPYIQKILPICFNEILFGFGESLFNKAYGMLGTSSMEAIYIGSEILHLALFICWGYGEAVSILVGTLLGEGRIEQAKEESRYHLGMSFIVGLGLWAFMAMLSPAFLKLYNITDPVIYDSCMKLLFVYGFKAFLRVFTYVMFCTLKAGGDSRIYNLLDSGIMYAIGIPLAFGGVYLGIRDVVTLVLICQIEQVVRFFLTLKRYNSYKWANNLTKLVNT